MAPVLSIYLISIVGFRPSSMMVLFMVWSEVHLRPIVIVAAVTLNTITPPPSSSYISSIPTETISSLVVPPSTWVVVGLNIIRSTILLRWVIPVSYTHLDVYKRQHLYYTLFITQYGK